MTNVRIVLIVTICLFAPVSSFCQDDISPNDKLLLSAGNFIERVQVKTVKLQNALTRQTKQFLQKRGRQEAKLKRKLSKIDSAAANKLFNDQGPRFVSGNTSSPYIPALDSTITSLKFLQENPQLVPSFKDVTGKAGIALSGIKQLQDKLQISHQVETYLRGRNEMIKKLLSSYTKLPKQLTAGLNNMRKELYYYSAQVNEYREMLKDPDKMVRKTLVLLGRTHAFQEFMKKYSQLAMLFQLPADYGNMNAMAGLQTRSQVQQLVQQQISAAGPNAQAMLQQNLDNARSQLNALKDKLAGGGPGDEDIPGFKPNNQKIKTFWKRLEYGTNIQNTRSASFLPATSDLGLSVGYRLNDKAVVGIGGSYKMGWGNDIRHIKISHEGASLRSFLDLRLKGSFYASGGFEYNYQPLSADSLPVLANPGPWRRSGLIGISKLVSMRSKLFRKTKLQLLWDFLSYEQQPRTPAIKFRVGYNF